MPVTRNVFFSDNQYNLRRDSSYSINLQECIYPAVFIGVVHSNDEFADVPINGTNSITSKKGMSNKLPLVPNYLLNINLIS